MSDQGLKRVLGLMLSDPVFRDAFAKEPLETLERYGIELTREELNQLLSSDIVDSAPLGEILDDRIKRRSDDMI